MNNDPGIICFQHCQKDSKVFTFKFPDICKLCGMSLSDTELRIPPFRIPYPFRKANLEPNILVIKPTLGDFLNNYENASDLHIGVTNSKGCVYEFDATGKEISNGETWTQCLPVRILENMTSSQKLHWDSVLNQVFNQTQWSIDRYNCESHNCYTFVLTFLRTLELQDLQPYLRDKTIFCENFVSPQARIAAKYISLYRKVKDQNIVVQ